MKPIRIDFVEETWKQFWLNVFWGDLIVNNSYISVELTCGCCGMKRKLEAREKDQAIKCPVCGVENKLDLAAWGW